MEQELSADARKAVISIILNPAVQDAKAMQDFDSESFLMGAEHSQKVKAAPIKSGYGSKDCVDLASSTAGFRIIQQTAISWKRG